MTYIPDIYSGVISVPIDTTLMIVENSQMINYGGLTIDGVLVINGDLILK
jgi:hypothetical protein